MLRRAEVTAADAQGAVVAKQAAGHFKPGSTAVSVNTQTTEEQKM